MRAIIVATGAQFDLPSFGEQSPAPPANESLNCMLTLIDRPFLQHIVEYLIGRGFTEFDFILSREPHVIEALLGDGTRWGSRFHFHLARDPHHPYELLPLITAQWPADTFLLAHADYLPKLAFDEAIGISPCLYYPQPAAPEDELEWTGWAWLQPGEVAELVPALDLRQLELALLAQSHDRRQVQKLEQFFTVRNRAGLLAAQASLLHGDFDELLRTGREQTPQIRLGRNARVHPSAKLVAPVFIGENSAIGANSIIGPNVVIDRNCLIEHSCLIEQATVLAHTYVGTNLTINRAILDGAELNNLRVGTRLRITNENVLARLTAPALRAGWQTWLRTMLERGFAGLLFALGAPCLLGIWLWRKLVSGQPVWQWQTMLASAKSSPGGELYTFECLRLAPVTRASEARPNDDADTNTQAAPAWHFWHTTFLPGLWNVSKGDLQFWGTRPRTYAEFNQLTEECRALYLQCVPGLFYERDALTEFNLTAASKDDEADEIWPIDLLDLVLEQQPLQPH